jgi:hypothetical protein
VGQTVKTANGLGVRNKAKVVTRTTDYDPSHGTERLKAYFIQLTTRQDESIMMVNQFYTLASM